MPKMKSHRGAMKRFSATGGGQIKRTKANKNHILTKKSAKRKRRLCQSDLVNPAELKRINRMMPYGPPA